jgi:hypothetical protein
MIKNNIALFLRGLSPQPKCRKARSLLCESCDSDSSDSASNLWDTISFHYIFCTLGNHTGPQPIYNKWSVRSHQQNKWGGTMNGLCLELRHPKEGHFNNLSWHQPPLSAQRTRNWWPTLTSFAFWVQRDQGGM